MASDPEKIIDLYQRYAEEWARDRQTELIEKDWLDRFLALLPSSHRAVLDLGCGSGDPIGRYLIEKSCEVTGVDSSPILIDMCKEGFPKSKWIVGDMRSLSLDRRFDGILTW